MKFLTTLGLCLFISLGSFVCKDSSSNDSSKPDDGGMASIKDDKSPKTIVGVAQGSKDHTTLVAAVQAAGLVDALANPGPFTVFAPTNAAFDKLPKGTVEELVKPEKKGDLEEVLYHHVIVGVRKLEDFKDGEKVTMFNGGSVTIAVKDGKLSIDGANVIASVPASNGIVHVIDGVLVPKK